jgi:hypothetical protein
MLTLLRFIERCEKFYWEDYTSVKTYLKLRFNHTRFGKQFWYGIYHLIRTVSVLKKKLRKRLGLRWLTSTNHKEIAILYFVFGILMGIFGALLSWVIRLDLAFPGSWYLTGNYELYNAIVTAHAIVMIFFSNACFDFWFWELIYSNYVWNNWYGIS